MAPPNIPYTVLSKWADGFSNDNLIGVGAYSKVYRAVCSDAARRTRVVADKWHPQQLAAATAAGASAALMSHVDAVRREINVLRCSTTRTSSAC